MTTTRRRSASASRKTAATEQNSPIATRRRNPLADKTVEAAIAQPSAPNKVATTAPTKKSTLPATSPLGADHDGSQSRCASFFRRLWAGLSLFAIFCGGVHLGQPVLIPTIFLVQYMMYNELVTLSYTHLLEKGIHDELIPTFSLQNWFWFGLTSFYSYSDVFAKNGVYTVPHYITISFALLCFGFVWFVMSLKKGHYRVQFGVLAWTWMSLLIFVISETNAVISMMFQGLFWIVLPTLLVITNDSWAYVWGLLFGRHSLLELSPKKTWEGFIGALISTPIQGFLMARGMLSHPILTCPTTVLSLTHPTCAVDPFFTLEKVVLPFVVPVLGWDHIYVAPAQMHTIYMSIFASLIGPFGGFFASGFKRAFAIKDFGSLIPGHGGFTDRMDCQLVMSIFVYVYYYAVVAPQSAVVTTADSLYALYAAMPVEQQAAFAKLAGF